LINEIVEWLLDVEWDIFYSYSRRSVTCNAQSICRNSQFNTKDPYITATRAIQTKKVCSMKFIIPFQVFTENFQRRVSCNATNFIIQHYRKPVSIRQRANLMS